LKIHEQQRGVHAEVIGHANFERDTNLQSFEGNIKQVASMPLTVANIENESACRTAVVYTNPAAIKNWLKVLEQRIAT
jgi:hypothetical protein